MFALRNRPVDYKDRHRVPLQISGQSCGENGHLVHNLGGGESSLSLERADASQRGLSRQPLRLELPALPALLVMLRAQGPLIY